MAFTRWESLFQKHYATFVAVLITVLSKCESTIIHVGRVYLGISSSSPAALHHRRAAIKMKATHLTQQLTANAATTLHFIFFHILFHIYSPIAVEGKRTLTTFSYNLTCIWWVYSDAAISPSSHTSVGHNLSKQGWALVVTDRSPVVRSLLLPNKYNWRLDLLILGLSWHQREPQRQSPMEPKQSEQAVMARCWFVCLVFFNLCLSLKQKWKAAYIETPSVKVAQSLF